MENMYSLDPATTSTGFHHQGPPQLVLEKLLHDQFEASEAANIQEINISTMDHHRHHHQHQRMSEVIKAQIASHPLYPDLVSAYIQCRQVGAPPEMALLLEEIVPDQSNNPLLCGGGGGVCSSTHEIGTDPELDEFMESYCKVLLRYKEELSKPFDEATTFLNNIEIELSNLLLSSKGTSSTPTNTTTTTSGTGSYHSPDGAAGSSEEELSYGEAEASESHESSVPRANDQELKKMLMRKYSGYLSSLRKEFLKKRKKGKLPKDARTTLMDWWNTHCRWPYPTEEEKMKLADVTGLDQKQINNWFINQRKRHWKPSADMRVALMEGVGGSGGGGGGAPVYFDSSGKGPADINDLC